VIPQELQKLLIDRFADRVEIIDANFYRIDTPELRLLVILSAEQSWVRMLVPISTAQEAMTFVEEILAANFDETLETHYALHDNALWGVFQHSLVSLIPTDANHAIDRLIELKELGIKRAFSEFATKQVKQIIQIAKQRGDSLEQTIQTLDRFYAEGVMGMEASQDTRQEMMGGWRYQLERLWHETD
jgi:hypothetical protein